MTMTNFAPRVGFAYQPPIPPNSVIRAGWGIYYTSQEDVNAQYSIVSQVITVNNAVSNVQGIPQYVLGVNAMPAVTVGKITQAQANAMTGTVQYLSTHQHSPVCRSIQLRIFSTPSQRVSWPTLHIWATTPITCSSNWNPFDCSSPADQYCVDNRNPYYGRYNYMQEVNSIGYWQLQRSACQTAASVSAWLQPHRQLHLGEGACGSAARQQRNHQPEPQLPEVRLRPDELEYSSGAHHQRGRRGSYRSRPPLG